MLELMVVTLVLGILAATGIGIVRYAFDQSNKTACGNNLQKLGKGAGAYNIRHHVYPRFAGGAFWKALYVDKERFLTDLDAFLCPATGDVNRDANGVPFWIQGEPTPPGPTECSYAGVSVATGLLRNRHVLGVDDDEGLGGAPNHSGGLNVLYLNGRVQWFDDPGDGSLRVGQAPPSGYPAELAELADMQN